MNHSSQAPATPATRQIIRVVQGLPATDGAGVELTRVIGQPSFNLLDPFLLLDAFRSDQPDDYIAGFPPHPHRGFETVTYLLAGRMRHQDSTGREGVIEPGGIQWMSAGRGVVHSEMPEQEDGLLEGFQLWINLPAAHKMDPPDYQEYPAGRIPVEDRDGAQVRVIAGATARGTHGPVRQPLTEPLYLDVQLPADALFSETLPENHNAFVYVIEGAVEGDGQGRTVRLNRDELGVFSLGEAVALRAWDNHARFLLIAGKPLNEPVARGGPFVMNTQEQVQQAFAEYQAGRF
jgi:redox-sensitive bicupin YhaK (pirin superfamily)